MCPQDAALQRSRQWCAGPEDREERLKQLLDWALGGFPAAGPDRPAAAGGSELRLLFVTPWACSGGGGSQGLCWSLPDTSKSDQGTERLFGREGPRGAGGAPGEAASINQLCAFIEKSSLGPAGGKPRPDGGSAWRKGRHKRGWRVQKKRSALADEPDDDDGDGDDASPDYVPNRRRPDRVLRKAAQPGGVYTQPDQRVRGSGRSQHRRGGG